MLSHEVAAYLDHNSDESHDLPVSELQIDLRACAHHKSLKLSDAKYVENAAQRDYRVSESKHVPLDHPK